MSVPRPAMLVATVIRPRLSRRGHHLRLVTVLARIEHDVLEAGCAQIPRQQLRIGHRIGADEHCAAMRLNFARARHDVSPPRVMRAEHPGRQHHPARRFAQRHADHRHAIYRAQFGLPFQQRSAHAAKVEITREKPLIGDLRGRDEFGCRLAAFLEFDQLVQAARPGAAGSHAPARVVDDVDGAIAHQVVLVAMKQMDAPPAPGIRLPPGSA